MAGTQVCAESCGDEIQINLRSVCSSIERKAGRIRQKVCRKYGSATGIGITARFTTGVGVDAPMDPRRSVRQGRARRIRFEESWCADLCQVDRAIARNSKVIGREEIRIHGAQARILHAGVTERIVAWLVTPNVWRTARRGISSNVQRWTANVGNSQCTRCTASRRGTNTTDG
jgi:hypothetical protein